MFSTYYIVVGLAWLIWLSKACTIGYRNFHLYSRCGVGFGVLEFGDLGFTPMHHLLCHDIVVCTWLVENHSIAIANRKTTLISTCHQRKQ